MPSPLQSFEYLNRGWDIRLVENTSLRLVFVAVLINIFIAGALVAALSYDLVRFARFDWSAASALRVCGLPAVRYSTVIYRRLSK